MDQIRVRGGRPLRGTIPISGAKNAALPLMAASLLSGKPVKLTNVPDLADIASMTSLLRQHGVRIDRDGGDMAMDAARIDSTVAPYDLVRKMRASVLVLGPLVARFGQAQVSLPGGCAIGNRPVDLHLKGLTDLGAEVNIEAGYIEAKAPGGRLRGGRVTFPFVSVGATENLMMAAALAEGESVLINAAREPEISDLAKLLTAMGAEIEGAGTDTIHIQGKPELGGAEHKVVADRIETGTYAMAVAIAGGDVVLTDTDLVLIDAAAETLRRAGVTLETVEGGIRVARGEDRVLGVDMMTEPYPGFPTDLQAQFMSLMTVSQGASMITETIFENRFMHVPELSRMGANITVHHASAMVRGVETLKGAQVMATDLRASVSLVLAGLAAEGETVINRIYHLDRGYQDLVGKLSACGADVGRVASERAAAEE
ncbi:MULTISPECIES: UDP-N-acetylglucosamine 1-carboxyvinyltransferase [Thalassobaculum]|uniref:UDP-N-acetylglucosamine 1-carboxyvinyltransferase n=2 Tax=Thalassobaculum TaxID=526215 RepID=A0A8G2BN18_9PROT|nr:MULTISPECIES: UDP-N-acetylglucosamine 1-carboxyvinyltransferase [Thalassobaculum]SDG56056.1 UDP-N-acetylglucosamine 1-carboxyvinyltransferase [Thalassobaculum litoreum DSM 18839]